MKNVIAIFTLNQKLLRGLQDALPQYTVTKGASIDDIAAIVKKNDVEAIVLHLTNANNWLIMSMLQSSYPHLPRFAILAPSLDKNNYDLEEMAKEYGAAGVTSEKIGVGSLVNLIRGTIQTDPEKSSKEKYLEVIGQVNEELARLQQEFFVTNLRTLPQPEIGQDSLNRLQSAYAGLNAIKIIP